MTTTIPIPPEVYPCPACDCQRPDHNCHCWDCCAAFNLLRTQIDAATGQELARLDIGYSDTDHESDAYRRGVREFARCRFCEWRELIVEVGDILANAEVDERASYAYAEHVGDNPECAALAYAYNAAQDSGGCNHDN